MPEPLKKDSKTQILSVSSAFYDYNIRAEIQLSTAEKVESMEKMLGFRFWNTPTVNAQIESLIKKENKMFFLI